MRNDGNSDEIDADDAGINDETINNEQDLAIFQQTYLNEGSNVKSLNVQAENDRQAKDEENAEIDMEKDNLLSTKVSGQSSSNGYTSSGERLPTQYFTQESARSVNDGYRPAKIEGIIDATQNDTEPE